MIRMENYLHEFLRVFFANGRLIKRVFLVFAVLTLLVPVVFKQNFDINAEVIVQSKKLSQSDANTALTTDSDKFVPPSLADMETESNILRSPTLIRGTIDELRQAGEFSYPSGLLDTLLFTPLQRYLFDPLHEHVINPLRRAVGLEVDPPRDTTLDAWTARAAKDLKVDTLPGSNVISVVYRSSDPAQGTRFVQQLLNNYLKSRQELQSTDLPQSFYEQKKVQYQTRLDDLEAQRQKLLDSAGAAAPKEEITFRLNAINTEEQALNQYRDRALEAQNWLNYLNTNLDLAKKAGLTDYTFPFSFANTVANVAYEDREIKQLGERLSEQVSRYGDTAQAFQAGSQPMQQQREAIARTRAQFLRVVSNRIRERSNDLEVLNSVIAQKTARIDRYKARVRQLQETDSKLSQVDTEVDALHKAFFTYTQRFEESRGQRLIDGALSNARILSEPVEPTEAAFPRPGVVIPLGLLTGLLLAIALGYVREFFDHRFKTPAQIPQHLGIPVLMIINAVEEKEVNPYKRWSWPWMLHWVRE